MADLGELLAKVTPRDPKQSPERRKEAISRATKAQNLARQALTVLYRDDYEDLYRQAKEHLAETLGPLPE